MESEIVQIKRRIEQECEALRLALDGFAIGASHDAIMARYNRLGACQDELEKLVGSDANDIICEAYIRHVG